MYPYLIPEGIYKAKLHRVCMRQVRDFQNPGEFKEKYAWDVHLEEPGDGKKITAWTSTSMHPQSTARRWINEVFHSQGRIFTDTSNVYLPCRVKIKNYKTKEGAMRDAIEELLAPEDNELLPAIDTGTEQAYDPDLPF